MNEIDILHIDTLSDVGIDLHTEDFNFLSDKLINTLNSNDYDYFKMRKFLNIYNRIIKNKKYFKDPRLEIEKRIKTMVNTDGFYSFFKKSFDLIIYLLKNKDKDSFMPDHLFKHQTFYQNYNVLYSDYIDNLCFFINYIDDDVKQKEIVSLFLIVLNEKHFMFKTGNAYKKEVLDVILKNINYKNKNSRLIYKKHLKEIRYDITNSFSNLEDFLDEKTNERAYLNIKILKRIPSDVLFFNNIETLNFIKKLKKDQIEKNVNIKELFRVINKKNLLNNIENIKKSTLLKIEVKNRKEVENILKKYLKVDIKVDIDDENINIYDFDFKSRLFLLKIINKKNEKEVSDYIKNEKLYIDNKETLSLSKTHQEMLEINYSN